MEDLTALLPAPETQAPLADDNPRPKRKPLQDAYDYLLEKKVSVPENYADFEMWVRPEERMKKLYERLKKDPAVDVNDDYETFKAEMLAPDAAPEDEKKKSVAGTVGPASSTTAGTGLADANTPLTDTSFEGVDALGKPIIDSPGAVDQGAARPFSVPPLPEDRLRIIQDEEATLPPVAEGMKRVPLPTGEFLSDEVTGTYKAPNTRTGQRYIDQPMSKVAEGEQEEQSLSAAALRTFTNGLIEGVEGLATGFDSADRLIRGTKAGQAIDRFGARVTGGLLSGDPNRGMPFGEAAETVAKTKSPIAEIYQQHDFLQKPSMTNLVLGAADLGAVAAATLPTALFPQSGAARLGATAMGLLFDGQIIKGANERAKAAGMTPSQIATYTLVDSALELSIFRLGGKALTGAAEKVLPKLTRDAVKAEIMRETYKRLAQRSDETLTRPALAAVLREATAAVTPRIAKIATEAVKNSMLFGAGQAKQVLTEAAARNMTGARFEEFSFEKLGTRVGEGVGSGLTIGALTGTVGSLRRPARAPEFDTDATDAARAKRLFPGIVRFSDEEGGAGRVTGVSPDHQRVTFQTKDEAGKNITDTIHGDYVFPSPTSVPPKPPGGATGLGQKLGGAIGKAIYGDKPAAPESADQPRVQVVDGTGRVVAPSVEVVNHIDNGSGSSFYVVRLPNGKLRNVPAKQVQRIGGPATEAVAGAPAEVLPTTSEANGGTLTGVVVTDTGEKTVLADYNADGTPVRVYTEEGTELDLPNSLAEPESRDLIQKAFDDQMAPPGEDSVAPIVAPDAATKEPAGPADPFAKRPVFTNAAGEQVFADYDPSGKPLRIFTEQQDYDLPAALGSAPVLDKVNEGARAAIAESEAAALVPAPTPAPVAPKPAAAKPAAAKPAAAKPDAPKPAAAKRTDLEAQIAAAEAEDAAPAPAAKRTSLEEQIAAAEAEDAAAPAAAPAAPAPANTREAARKAANADMVAVTKPEPVGLDAVPAALAEGIKAANVKELTNDLNTSGRASARVRNPRETDEQWAQAVADRTGIAQQMEAKTGEKLVVMSGKDGNGNDAVFIARAPEVKPGPAKPTPVATTAPTGTRVRSIDEQYLYDAIEAEKAKDTPVITAARQKVVDAEAAEKAASKAHAAAVQGKSAKQRRNKNVEALDDAWNEAVTAADQARAELDALIPAPGNDGGAITMEGLLAHGARLAFHQGMSVPVKPGSNQYGAIPKNIRINDQQSFGISLYTPPGKKFSNGYIVYEVRKGQFINASNEFRAKSIPEAIDWINSKSDTQTGVMRAPRIEQPPTLAPASPAAPVAVEVPTKEVSSSAGDPENQYEARRAAGSFTEDGVTFTRQPVLDPAAGEIVYGKPASVEFAARVDVPVRFAVVDADRMQPTVTGGTANRNHFLLDAQPKKRTDGASGTAIQQIANAPDLGKVGAAPDAYGGAPVMNGRGELIQGNARGEGIRQHYAQGGTSYRAQLDAAAGEFGIDPASYAGMAKPVLVRLADVDDATAKDLGNYTALDRESGGVRRLDPKQSAARMSARQRIQLANILTPIEIKGETETPKATIRRQQRALQEFFANAPEVANNTQLQTLFDKKGGITTTGIEDVELLTRSLLLGDAPLLEQQFEELRKAAQDGILKALPSIVGLDESVSILPKLQNAIGAARDYKMKRGDSQLPFASWAEQGDLMNAAPNQRYTPLEMRLAELLSFKSQNEIASEFARYARFVQPVADPLFGGRAALSPADAIKQIFNVDEILPNPPQNGTDPGTGSPRRSDGPARISESEPRGVAAPGSPARLLDDAPAGGNGNRPEPQPGGTVGGNAGSADVGRGKPVADAGRVERAKAGVATAKTELETAKDEQRAAKKAHLLNGSKAVKQRVFDSGLVVRDKQAALDEAKAELDGAKKGQPPVVKEVRPDGSTNTVVMDTTPVAPAIVQGNTAKGVLTAGIEKITAAFGEKKAKKYFEEINRLFDPTKYDIVEYRKSGVVIKEGDKFTFHAVLMDGKTWSTFGTSDVTQEFTTAPPAASSEAPVRPPLLTATPELLPTVPERVPAGRYEIDEAQRLGVNLAFDRIKTPELGFLLADGTGVGKTREILAIADQLSQEGPVLIITANQGIIDNNFRKDAKAMGIKPSANVTLGTYTELSDGKFSGKKYRAVIYDEGHNLKNAETGKATKARALDARNAIYVTATPMDTPGGAVYFAAAVTNRPPAEIWEQLGLEYLETKNAETGEILVEVKLKDGTSPSQIIGNIAKLRNRLYEEGAMIRREYPFFGTVSSTEIPLTALQATEQAAITEYWDGRVEEEPGKRMNLRGQQSGDLSRWNEANKAKYAAKRIVEELAAGRKVVVLAEGVNNAKIKGLEDEVRTGFLNTLALELKKLGISFAKVYGSGNKGNEVERFQGGEVDVLIGTSKSAGTGYDMDDSAGDKPRTLILVTPPYGGDTFQQILGRVSRRNTKTPAKAEIIYTKADVDARRKEIVDGKLRVLKAIQDGTLTEDVDVAAYGGSQNNQRQAAGQSTVGVEKISEQAFLVVGEGTKPLKEDLKRMGAKWYKDKKTGKQGWIFPNYRQTDVEQYLRDKNALPAAGADAVAQAYTALEEIQQRRQVIVDQIKSGNLPTDGMMFSSFIPIPPKLLELYIEYAKTWIEEGVVRTADLVQRFRAMGVGAKYDDEVLGRVAQRALDENQPAAAAAATPPPAPPKADKGKGASVGGGRYKRRTVETIKENPSVSDKFKKALDADEDISTYVRRANALSVDEANAVIELMGEDAAYEFALTEAETLHKATSQILRGVLAMRLDAKGAAADVAGNAAEADAYMRRSTAIFADMAKRATEYGQASAVLVELLRAQPDRAIYQTRKDIYQQVQRALKGAEPTIRAAAEAARQAQREALDETLLAVGDEINLTVQAPPAPEIPIEGRAPDVPAGWGNTNKMFTKAWMAEQFARLANMRFTAPIPPQLIITGLYHIEAGARAFTKFSRVMISQFGKGIRPSLMEIYQRTRDAYVRQMGGTLADHQLQDDATVVALMGDEVAERMAGRVISAVNDRQTGAFDPEAQMLSTLMSKVRAGLPDASSLATGNSLTPTKGTPVPMKERIAEAVRNAADYADLWEQAKDTTLLRIEMLDLSADVKTLLHDRLENFYHEVIGQPYSDRQVQQAMSTELGGMGPDGKRARIESIIRQGFTEVKYVRDELVRRLVTEANLTPDQAAQLTKSVEAEFNRRVDAKRGQMKQAILNPIKRLVVRGNRTFADKLAYLIKLGAFDDADVADQYAGYLNLPTLSAADVTNLTALAKTAEAAPEGFQKDRAMTDLLAYQSKIKGIRLGEILQAYWYGNVLSSYLTQSYNLATNTVKTATEVFEASLHMMLLAPRRPGLWLSPARGLARGIMPAFTESLNILKTGYEPTRDIGKYETPNVLEQIDFAEKSKLLAPLNALKLVTRVMKAGDVMHSGSLAEMRAEELAILESLKENKGATTAEIRQRVSEKLFQTADKFADAQAQAEGEGLPVGSRDYRRRVWEIMQQQRDVKLREESREYGIRTTFNGEMEGSLGAVISGFTAGIDKVTIKGFRVLRFVFPFTKVPTNILNEMMYYSPLGFLRAARKGIGTKGDGTNRFYREYTPHERQRAAIKAVLGTALYMVGYSLTHSDKEGEEPLLQITGGGTGNVEHDRELREQGWQPYSIGVGGMWFPYSLLPGAVMLAAVGHVNDQEKYKKQADIESQKMAFVTLFKTMQFAQEISPLRGPADLLGALNSRNPDQISNYLNRLIGGSARGFVPLSGLTTQAFKDIAETANLPKKQVDTIFGNFVQDMPFARRGQRDAVNALGEYVSYDTDRFMSSEHKRPDADSEKVWKYMLDHNQFFSKPSQNTVQIPDFTTNTMRQATEDEYYRIIMRRGQHLKQAMINNLSLLEALDEEQAKGVIAAFCTDASARAEQEIALGID